jgi:extradiol dioxygenase
MEIRTLGYLGFCSPNYEEWLTFGPEVFAFGLGPRGADGAIRLRMDDRHHRIAIHPGEHHDVLYMGWELRNRLAFADGLKHLEAKNVAYTIATKEELDDRHVTEMAWFLDPAGFRHEIYHSQEFEPMSFTPGRPISGFVADEMGVGHLVLAVPEVTDEIRNFALEVLGFKIFAGFRHALFDGKILGLEFYYCANGRSHCLGYVPAEGKRGVTHFAVEVNTLDDVGRAYDIVQDRQIPIKMSLGRTQIDSSISFYCRTPTGFEFEYMYDGMMIRDETFVTRKPKSINAWGHRSQLKGWGESVRSIE